MSLDKKILDFKPRFKKSNVAYSREENDGYVSFRFQSPGTSNETILNDTCVEIIKICNGQNSIKDIVDHIMATYEGAPLDLVVKDVVETVQKLMRMQLITWEEENPFIPKYRIDLGEGYSIYRADYSDIPKINNFFKLVQIKEDKPYDNYQICLNKYIPKWSINSEVLRTGFLTDMQYIFMLEKDGEVVGTTYSVDNNNKCIHTIISLVCKKDILCLDSFVSYVFSLIPQISTQNLTGYRIHVGNEENELMNVLKSTGFEKTLTLENEIGFGKDLLEYNYYI